MENPIKIQLRVLSRHVRVKRGERARIIRAGDETRYLIGSAPEAFLSCDEAILQPEHCWVIVNSRGVYVRMGSPEASATLNDREIRSPLPVSNGDLLRIGPLQLELRVSGQPAGAADVPPLGDAKAAPSPADPMEDEIMEFLMAEDAAERERRKGDRQQLRFDELEPASRRSAEPVGEEKEEKPRQRGTRKVGKLPPPPPPPAAASSLRAAEDALKHMFTRRPATTDKDADDKQG